MEGLEIKGDFTRHLISLWVWLQKSVEYFFDFGGLWIKPCKATCRKWERWPYFVIVPPIFFFFPSFLDHLLRLHLFWLNQSAPDIWIMAQLKHTHAAGWAYPLTFVFLFWCDAWYLGCLPAQLLKPKASLVCAAERCRGDHRSDTPFPAEHSALSLIREMEKHFKDSLWFCLSLIFILPPVF